MESKLKEGEGEAEEEKQLYKTRQSECLQKPKNYVRVHPKRSKTTSDDDGKPIKRSCFSYDRTF